MTVTADPAAFVMPFGKHRDKPLRDIPKGYLHWCLDNVSGMHAETRVAITAYVGGHQSKLTTETPAPSTRSTPRARRASPATDGPAAAAPACCRICGGPGSDDRPLVHGTCVKDDVPF